MLPLSSAQKLYVTFISIKAVMEVMELKNMTVIGTCVAFKHTITNTGFNLPHCNKIQFSYSFHDETWYPISHMATRK